MARRLHERAGMEFIKPGTRYNFVGRSRLFVTISSTFVVLSLLLIFFRGMNYGIDFAGGTEVQVRFGKAVELAAVRRALVTAGFPQAGVQTYGSADDNELLIRIQETSSVTEQQAIQIEARIRADHGAENLHLYRFDVESDKIDLRFNERVDPDKLGETLKLAGLAGAELRDLSGGEAKEFIVIPRALAASIENALATIVGADQIDVRRVDFVGPTVGKSLRDDGLAAALYTLVAILVYVAFRFDFWFAPGAIVAIIHDVVITGGIFSAFGLQVDLTVVAAMLTIIGYSLNDTIVVFDRIRENAARFKFRAVEELVNSSVNETLSRTLLTSATTLFVVLSLLLLGGEALRSFSLALLIGILLGTYSTLYIANPVYIYLRGRFDSSHARDRARGASGHSTPPAAP